MATTSEKKCYSVLVLLMIIYYGAVTAANIDCKGKPFHCVNSSHFMICVDFGNGVSQTVNDFLIHCPPTTVCRDTNTFECEYLLPSTIEPFQQEVKEHITTDSPLQETAVTGILSEYVNNVSDPIHLQQRTADAEIKATPRRENEVLPISNLETKHLTIPLERTYTEQTTEKFISTTSKKKTVDKIDSMGFLKLEKDVELFVENTTVPFFENPRQDEFFEYKSNIINKTNLEINDHDTLNTPHEKSTAADIELYDESTKLVGPSFTVSDFQNNPYTKDTTITTPTILALLDLFKITKINSSFENAAPESSQTLSNDVTTSAMLTQQDLTDNQQTTTAINLIAEITQQTISENTVLPGNSIENKVLSAQNNIAKRVTILSDNNNTTTASLISAVKSFEDINTKSTTVSTTNDDVTTSAMLLQQDLTDNQKTTPSFNLKDKITQDIIPANIVLPDEPAENNSQDFKLTLPEDIHLSTVTLLPSVFTTSQTKNDIAAAFLLPTVQSTDNMIAKEATESTAVSTISDDVTTSEMLLPSIFTSQINNNSTTAPLLPAANSVGNINIVTESTTISTTLYDVTTNDTLPQQDLTDRQRTVEFNLIDKVTQEIIPASTVLPSNPTEDYTLPAQDNDATKVTNPDNINLNTVTVSPNIFTSQTNNKTVPLLPVFQSIEDIKIMKEATESNTLSTSASDYVNTSGMLSQQDLTDNERTTSVYNLIDEITQETIPANIIPDNHTENYMLSAQNKIAVDVTIADDVNLNTLTQLPSIFTTLRNYNNITTESTIVSTTNNDVTTSVTLSQQELSIYSERMQSVFNSVDQIAEELLPTMNNLSGNLIDKDMLLIQTKDAQQVTISHDTSFETSTLSLPIVKSIEDIKTKEVTESTSVSTGNEGITTSVILSMDNLTIENQGLSNLVNQLTKELILAKTDLPTIENNVSAYKNDVLNVGDSEDKNLKSLLKANNDFITLKFVPTVKSTDATEISKEEIGSTTVMSNTLNDNKIFLSQYEIDIGEPLNEKVTPTVPYLQNQTGKGFQYSNALNQATTVSHDNITPRSTLTTPIVSSDTEVEISNNRHHILEMGTGTLGINNNSPHYEETTRMNFSDDTLLKITENSTFNENTLNDSELIGVTATSKSEPEAGIVNSYVISSFNITTTGPDFITSIKPTNDIFTSADFLFTHASEIVNMSTTKKDDSTMKKVILERNSLPNTFKKDDTLSEQNLVISTEGTLEKEVFSLETATLNDYMSIIDNKHVTEPISVTTVDTIRDYSKVTGESKFISSVLPSDTIIDKVATNNLILSDIPPNLIDNLQDFNQNLSVLVPIPSKDGTYLSNVTNIERDTLNNYAMDEMTNHTNRLTFSSVDTSTFGTLHQEENSEDKMYSSQTTTRYVTDYVAYLHDKAKFSTSTFKTAIDNHLIKGQSSNVTQEEKAYETQIRTDAISYSTTRTSNTNNNKSTTHLPIYGILTTPMPSSNVKENSMYKKEYNNSVQTQIAREYKILNNTGITLHDKQNVVKKMTTAYSDEKIHRNDTQTIQLPRESSENTTFIIPLPDPQFVTKTHVPHKVMSLSNRNSTTTRNQTIINLNYIKTTAAYNTTSLKAPKMSNNMDNNSNIHGGSIIKDDGLALTPISERPEVKHDNPLVAKLDQTSTKHVSVLQINKSNINSDRAIKKDERMFIIPMKPIVHNINTGINPSRKTALPEIIVMKEINKSQNKTMVAGKGDESSINNTPFTCRNRLRGRYADENDCRRFYICIGKLQPLYSACPMNTIFSEIKKQCTKKLSHCIRNNQFQCIKKGRFSDVLRDNVYYICVENNDAFVRFKFQCQDGFYLNKTTVKCINNYVKPRQISSTSVDIDSNKASDQSLVENNSKKMKHRERYVCKKEGKFPDRHDCRRYYVCSKKSKSFRRRTKKCDSDEVFHPEKEKCVDSDSYECN